MDAPLAPLGALRTDITPLKRKPGVPRPFVHRFEASDDMRLQSIDVGVDGFETDLELELVGQKVKVDGELRIDWHGPCRRCLEPTTGTTVTPIDELFEFEPIDGETYPREEDYIDLRPMVTEQILMSLPLAPLCDESCRGFGDQVTNRDVLVDHLDHPDEGEATVAEGKDPRWAALDDLSFE